MWRSLTSNSPAGDVFPPTFWVRRVSEDRIFQRSGSAETGTSGLAFMIAETSAKNITRTSRMRRRGLRSSSMESRKNTTIRFKENHAMATRNSEIASVVVGKKGSCGDRSLLPIVNSGLRFMPHPSVTTMVLFPTWLHAPRPQRLVNALEIGI